MKIPYYQVDAFVDGPFSGNPAGVCLLNQWADDELLQNIALENQLSETAFLVGRGSSHELRWFTPEAEVDLCGHATLASAHVLFRELDCPESTLAFDSRSGRLGASRTPDGIQLDFPARSVTPVAETAALSEAIGARVVEAHQAIDDLLLVLESERAIRQLTPDLAAIAALPARGVIVTAAGENSDIVSRFFGPAVGVDEDPVTGSAHCTLTPFWCERLGLSRLRARQLSARGGTVSCVLEGDRVLLSGQCTTFLTGFIHLQRSGP